MLRIHFNKAIDFYESSYNLDIEDILSIHVDSSSIVINKFIHNIFIQYTIYKLQEMPNCYNIYIKLFNSNSKCIRRFMFTLKNGINISNIELNFYINKYYVTVFNNKFSIYKNNKAIFNNIDAGIL